MRIHFIGIGGIGVSALARYYLSQGHKVSGSDLVSSEITDALSKKGVKIFIGKHQSKNVSNYVEMIIYSPAIRPNNPELQKGQKLKIVNCKLKIKSYPEALGELTKKYFTIAVCGSHGKSTVASMLGLLLTNAGLDPTVIIGTKLKEFGDSNFRIGKGKYLVIEADEHFASFLNYWPKIIVLTAIEKDHLDYYKSFKNYILAFKKFISRLPPPLIHRCGGLPKDGFLVANKDDKNIEKLVTHFPRPLENVLWYYLEQKEAKKLKKILKIPGEFNVSNALAALTTARALKIPDKISLKVLSKYKGSWRRFDIKKITTNNQRFTIINDYAHHPAQVKATLKAARDKFPKNKIWCVYQPHQYQRTYYLFNDFVDVFAKAPVDKIIITDIYDVAGREDKTIKRKVSSEKLVNKIKKQNSRFRPALAKATASKQCYGGQARGKNSIMYIPTVQEVSEYLKKNLWGSRLKKGEPRSKGAGEVVIIMGAGDIYNLSKELEKPAVSGSR